MKKLNLNLLFTKIAYKIGLCKTYRIVYSAETNGFEPKEYHVSRPFGKFFYKEDRRHDVGNPVGEGITCYVPAVDDIRRFRLDRINRFELIA
jgi:hypothetical protein